MTRPLASASRSPCALFAAVSVDAQPPPSPVLTEMPKPNGTPVPRTPDGRADLSGVWNKAIHQNTSRPVEPLPFTPAGLKAFNEVAELIDPTSRCILPGVPRVNNSPYPFQIMQLPDRVVFVYEYMHNFRVIYTDGRGHRAHWEPSLMGDSVGRWDGDTLVIETVNLTDRTWLDDHGNRHSDALRVTERWRRMSADELWYRGDDRRPEVLHAAMDDGLGHSARAEGLGNHGVRLYRQQQRPVRRPSSARLARRIRARRHGHRYAASASPVAGAHSARQAQ